MSPTVSLAPGAEENGLASMLADLVRQNLESKPHKQEDFNAIKGNVAIVCDDAEVALTLKFDHGSLEIFNGISGVPDATIRGNSEAIMALSNLPLTRRFALPLPDPRDKEAVAVLKSVVAAVRKGDFKIYGFLSAFSILNRLTKVMSING